MTRLKSVTAGALRIGFALVLTLLIDPFWQGAFAFLDPRRPPSGALLPSAVVGTAVAGVVSAVVVALGSEFLTFHTTLEILWKDVSTSRVLPGQVLDIALPEHHTQPLGAVFDLQVQQNCSSWLQRRLVNALLRHNLQLLVTIPQPEISAIVMTPVTDVRRDGKSLVFPLSYLPSLGEWAWVTVGLTTGALPASWRVDVEVSFRSQGHFTHLLRWFCLSGHSSIRSIQVNRSQ